MSLVIVSGLSGSGKSVALHALEDLDFYCVDNLPVGLLGAFAEEILDQRPASGKHVAAGIDARNRPGQLARFPTMISGLRNSGVACRIIFLQADDATLVQRYSETRRKHPLTDSETTLADAIGKERSLLAPISDTADLLIDTSDTNVHELRDIIMASVGASERSGFTLLLRSFGFKHGIPLDTDFLFDARCLPNPHWEPELRALTGRDKKVADYLEQHTIVHDYYAQLEEFLTAWIPQFRADNRSYLSIAIGCTGGQHRSVYLVNRLARQLGMHVGEVIERHRELDRKQV